MKLEDMIGNLALQLVSILNPTSFENKPLVLFKRGFIIRDTKAC